MDITLQQESLSFYAPVYTACTSQENTAESVVPDRMPDVHRLLDTDAAVYLRRRTVGMGEITLEGEIRAAVLFKGEEDDTIQKLDFELPCSFSIPVDGAGERDQLRASLSIHRAEARIINPRKLGLSVETRAAVELYRPETVSVTVGAESDELETLVREEDIRFYSEPGEKSFTVMEEYTLPAGRPLMGELLSARAFAVLSDQKTVGGKSILQGSARWELRYLDIEGNPAQERFSVPFSQLIDIPEETAGVDVMLTPESAYAELIPASNGSDTVSLELHLVAQSICWTQKTLTLLSDAYSVHRDCRTEYTELSFSAPGERTTLRGTADASLELPEAASDVLYSYVRAGNPEVVNDDLSLPARAHILYRTEEGELRSVLRSVAVVIPGGGAAEGLCFSQPVFSEPTLSNAGDRLELRLSAELTAFRVEKTAVSCVKSAELSEEAAVPDENELSLILIRPSGQSLWELAKRYHSTIALIRASNPENGEGLMIIPRAR